MVICFALIPILPFAHLYVNRKMSVCGLDTKLASQLVIMSVPGLSRKVIVVIETLVVRSHLIA